MVMNKPFPAQLKVTCVSRVDGGRQRGLAIITVLLIIALMVILLGFMVEQQHLLIRRIANQNVAEQGFQYATGVDDWASRVLHDDKDRVIDYLGEDWAEFGAPPKTEPNGRKPFSLDTRSQREKEALPEINFGKDVIVQYQIQDLNALFNLNNLSSKDPRYAAGQKSIFLNLLNILKIGEFDVRTQLYGALVDWMDENDLERANGVESGSYRIKSTPYYAADQKLTSLGELRFVEGFDEDVINKLKPYVTVLPVENVRVNINTASAEVLSSLSAVPVVDTSSVDTFIAQRLEEGFAGFQPPQIEVAKTAILGTAPVNGQVVSNMLQTTSQFFQINTRVLLGDYLYCTQTKVLREPADPSGTDRPKVTILNREYSTFCDEIIR